MQNQNIPDTLIAAVQNDAVIAYATEAVFGLGCSPDSTAGLERLLALKERPVEKGLNFNRSKYRAIKTFCRF